MASKIQRCGRCSRRYRGSGDWNVTYVKGFAVNVLCPACQSAEENAEAVINEATTDYSKMVAFNVIN